MRESDLYAPVRDWLRAKGWIVHVERFDSDIVARMGDKLLAVDLKLVFSQELVNQLHHRAAWADFVIAATPTAARDARHYSIAKYAGYGLLRVEGGKVRQILKPQPQPWQWRKRRAYRLKKLIGEAPAMDHEVAGLPSCPQLRAQRQRRAESQSEGYFNLIVGGGQ